MTLRADALRWLSGRNVNGGHVVTSKRYGPDESWTKKKAWWVRVPLSAIKDGKTIHIVCETEPGAKSFRHLQVPAEFFQQHSNDFALIGGDNVNLFLSADEGIEFEDQRGSGHTSFAHFEQA